MSDPVSEVGLSNLSREERRFPPSAEFARASKRCRRPLRRGAADRLAFWDDQAAPARLGPAVDTDP